MPLRRKTTINTQKNIKKLLPHTNFNALYLSALIFVPSILVSSNGYEYLFGTIYTINVNLNPDQKFFVMNYELADEFGISRLSLFTFVSLVTDIICQSGFIYNLYENRLRTSAFYLFYQNVVFVVFSSIYFSFELLKNSPKVYNYNILFFIVKNVINFAYFMFAHLHLKNEDVLPRHYSN